MRASLVPVLIAFAAAPAAGHDTWLLPRPGASAGTIELELTSAGSFPTPESVVDADRIARSGLRLAGHSEPLQVAGKGDKVLRLRARAEAAGVATAWIETHPRTLTLNQGELAHYLEEIGAEAIAVEWKRSGLASWRESYVKLAKALVRVGAAAEDPSWGEAVGMELELVPERDPTSMRPDQSLDLRVLFRGQPLAGQVVSAVRREGDLPLQKTNADGRVRFTLDGVGPWMVRATRIERVPSRRGLAQLVRDADLRGRALVPNAARFAPRALHQARWPRSAPGPSGTGNATLRAPNSPVARCYLTSQVSPARRSRPRSPAPLRATTPSICSLATVS